MPPNQIESVWKDISPGITRALDTASGEATPEDTKLGLVAGRTQLLMMWDGPAVLGVVFQILSFPRYKIARVLVAFGKDMRALERAIRSAEAWGKEQGCEYVEGWVATRSRERLFARFGYSRAYTIIRRRLK